MTTTATERGVLSFIARVFDLLRLLSPVTFRAKHIMQKIWHAQISWDDPLPTGVAEEWQAFIHDFPKLSEISIRRFVGTSSGASYCLCGFSDASIKGYAAVVYLRVTDAEGNVKLYLHGAKSKLVPMKQSTVPRLELCAAGLLSIWMSRIKKTLEEQLVLSAIFCWTDSSIVLSWLTNSHTSFNVFVSNRIFKIHQTLPNCQWAYVRTEQNPADCVSRGLTPKELQSHKLYWSGPDFLLQPISKWNLIVPSVPTRELPELRPISLVASSVEPIDDWLTRFSSYGNLLRVVAWMRRFVIRNRGQTTNTVFLTQNELDEALVSIVKSTQNLFYPELIRELKARSVVHNKGLARLCPFLDEKLIIRVGGRLRNSNLRDDRKHPILLPKNCHLALLTARYWHVYACHAGPRLMTAMIHKQFWIVSVRQVVHHVLHQCTVCFRHAAKHP